MQQRLIIPPRTPTTSTTTTTATSTEPRVDCSSSCRACRVVLCTATGNEVNWLNARVHIHTHTQHVHANERTNEIYSEKCSVHRNHMLWEWAQQCILMQSDNVDTCAQKRYARNAAWRLSYCLGGTTERGSRFDSLERWNRIARRSTSRKTERCIWFACRAYVRSLYRHKYAYEL